MIKSVKKVLSLLQEHEETKKALTKSASDLAEIKRESHKRKKLLMTQQQMIQTGPGSYNKVSLDRWTLGGHWVDTCLSQLVGVRDVDDHENEYNTVFSGTECHTKTWSVWFQLYHKHNHTQPTYEVASFPSRI